MSKVGTASLSWPPRSIGGWPVLSPGSNPPPPPPHHFGYLRSRWTCSTLVLLLAHEYQVNVSRETVRRYLQHSKVVWRRPRPILRPKDPDYVAKVLIIKLLVNSMPDDKIALFQDEAEVCTNPKIGSLWMPRGQQAAGETPGTNEKQHLFGSLAWNTCRLVTTWAKRRDSAAFREHLDHLRCIFRCYRRIHLICDNAHFHISRAVQDYLKNHPRVTLHYLPKCAPETNPIERVWWHLHDEITRNHTCPDLDSLLNLVDRWLHQNRYCLIEPTLYAVVPRKLRVFSAR
ncbi:MAG: IS630 family transposase [Gemmatales bacterium]